MKKIPLTGKNGLGKFAIVDADDYEHLMRWKWHVDCKGYPSRSQNMGKINGKVKIKTFKMHRDIMHHHDRAENIDHIDGNKLDNRKVNLRPATHSQNSMNKKPQANAKSKYKGVSWRGDGRWRARIMANGRSRHIGNFTSEVEAARAYNIAALIEHGEFARLNKIEVMT